MFKWECYYLSSSKDFAEDILWKQQARQFSASDNKSYVNVLVIINCSQSSFFSAYFTCSVTSVNYWNPIDNT